MIKKGITFIVSLLLVFIINFKFNEVDNYIMFGDVNMLNSLLGLTGCYYIISRAIENGKNIKRNIFSVILGIIFASISVHVPIKLVGIMESGLVTSKYIKFAVLTYVAYTIILSAIISNVFAWFENAKINSEKFLEKNEEKIRKIEKFILGSTVYSYITTIIIGLLVFTPVILHYYPGGFSPDVIAQLKNGFLNIPNNHHPYVHTLIFSGIVRFFYGITNNITLSFAIFIYIQIIVFSLTVARIISFMNKRNVDIRVRFMVLLSYVFSPVFLLYMIFPWKDILFTLVFTNFTVELIDIILDSKYKKDNEKRKIDNWIYMIYVGILIFFSMVLRHNGYYTILLTIPFALIFLRKDIKKIAPIFLLPLMLYIFLTGYVYKEIINMPETSEGEKYSIPMQTISRIGKYKDEELTDEEKEKIREFMLYDRARENYIPWISDNAKWGSNNENLKNRSGEFIKLYLDLASRFPEEAVLALIEQTEGYYAPESFRLKIYVEHLTFEQMGVKEYENLPVFEFRQIVKNPIIDKVFAAIFDREIMIISWITSIGLVVWGIVVTLGYVIYKKEYMLMLAYIPIALFVLTCIASPVSGDLRYALPAFTLLPIFITLPTIINKIKESNE